MVYICCSVVEIGLIPVNMSWSSGTGGGLTIIPDRVSGAGHRGPVGLDRAI